VSPIHLRDYQTEARDAFFRAWSGGMRRPAEVLPTGAGKTVIFSDLAREFHRWRTAANGDNIGNGGERTVVLVHRDELADQALEQLSDWAPDLSTGKIKAGHNEIDRTVMVASVQTVSRDNRLENLIKGQELFGEIGLIITDECHHAPAPSYRKIYDAFPDALNAGVTATLARGDGVGLGSVWDDVVYTKSILWMISRGYLVDVIPMSVRLDQLDLSKIRKTAGDFQAKALGTAMVDAGSPAAVAAALRKYAPDRRSIVFCPDVFSATATAKAIGPSAAVVGGRPPPPARRLIYKLFETGDLRVIVNCMVLTEGFDAPWADCIVIARPTQSAPLFAQMVGRGLRSWPGKTNCLLLDVTGTGGRLSTLIDLAPGEVRDVQPGESLAEAAIRYEIESNVTLDTDSIAFALKHRDLDLFTASSKAWLRTDGGVLFIPVGYGHVFLWPAGDGRWDVGAAPARGKWRRLHRNLPLGTAQAWAETEADELTSYRSRSGDKSARWRKESANGSLIGQARRYGYLIPDTPTKGEISDLIAVGKASEKFDPIMRKIK
jgi:superfamily II DNA or RNA helicase